MTDFLIYDVFTDAPFGGNPLGVIPDATGLPEPMLQKIARELNFSETTFVFPPADPGHTARVRIFTPRQEIPFAGHPLIGTAVALDHLGHGPDMVLEVGTGPIPARAENGAAQFTTSTPLTRIGTPTPEAIAACLSLGPSDIRTDRLAPVQAGVGIAFAFAELRDRAALSRAQPVTDAFTQAAREFPTPLDFAVMAFLRDGPLIEARMFAPLDGIPEDAATGSAAAALSALLAEADGASGDFTISQGVDMGRPSVIRTSVTLTSGVTSSVTVSGHAIRMASGRLSLP